MIAPLHIVQAFLLHLCWIPLILRLLLLIIAYIKPKACSDMYIQNQEEAYFEKLKWKLKFIWRIQISYQFLQPQDSKELKHRNSIEEPRLLLKYLINDKIKWNSWQEINQESTLQILLSNLFRARNLITSHWIDIGCPKLYYDIKNEQEVKDVVNYIWSIGFLIHFLFHLSTLERYWYWHFYAIVDW